MSFTVNPAEAQAMQEDEAQLLNAIVQTTRTTLGLLHQSSNIQRPTSPTIRMQGRLVYGLVGTQLRNELTPERLQMLLDVMQQPVSEGVDPKQYKGKTAAIEIRDAGIILFRQEQDSRITVNQFQQQQSQNHSQSQNRSPEIEL